MHGDPGSRLHPIDHGLGMKRPTFDLEFKKDLVAGKGLGDNFSGKLILTGSGRRPEPEILGSNPQNHAPGFQGPAIDLKDPDIRISPPFIHDSPVKPVYRAEELSHDLLTFIKS